MRPRRGHHQREALIMAMILPVVVAIGIVAAFLIR